MSEKEITDLQFTTAYNNLQKAVKSNDLMFAGIHALELINDGYKLPFDELYKKYPQVNVFTSNQKTAQSLDLLH